MRKGEKLIKYYTDSLQDLNGVDFLIRDHMILQMIRNIPNERFDEIIREEEKLIREEQIQCTRCRHFIWHNPRVPLLQNEKDNFICSFCAAEGHK